MQNQVITVAIILLAASSLSADDKSPGTAPNDTTSIFHSLWIDNSTEVLSDNLATNSLNDFGHSEPANSTPGVNSIDQAIPTFSPQATRNDSIRPISFQSADLNPFNDDILQANCIPRDSGACATPAWKPLDTLSLFGGLEGSKQPQDFGVNANFGSRWAANWGFPLLAEYGLGAQIGTSINYTNNAVQVFDRLDATSHRTQSFSTIGVFQRIGQWRWGVGYDVLYESYYDNFLLGQWRGRAGYAITATDEVGVWSTIAQRHDSGAFLNIPVTLTPLTQGSIYWQHTFETGARIMGWCGVSEGHAQANLALGDLKKTGDQFVFGAEIDVPLNRYLALYGQANFISPADTGTVDSYLGVAYYPGGHAYPVSRSLFAPLQALANSTMFATDIRRN